MLPLLRNFKLGTIGSWRGRARRQRPSGPLPVRAAVFLVLLLLGTQALAQPTITGISPVPNARAASASGAVTIGFSQPLLSGSAAALQVFSSQRGGRRTSGGTPAVVSGSTLTFTPSAYDFRPGETVFSTVTTAASSSSGSLVQPWVGQFTAAAGGTGVGTFVPQPLNPEAPVASSPYGVAAGDVDADGDLDLLVTNPFGGTVGVRFNDGTGNYSGSASVAVVGQPAGLALGDVDGDGDLDLVTANHLISGSNTASVRLNNGAGSFSGGADVAVGSFPRSVALGDVDGDGDLDLLTANGAGTVSIRFNNGAGSFSGGSDPAVGANPQHIALGDVDGDGDLDFMTANFTANTVSVRLNNGAGSFGGGSDVAVGSGPLGVALGDVDGDGDLDFVTANVGGNVSIRFNSGSGSFAGGSNPTLGIQLYSVSLSDVDHDGDLDLLVTDGNSVVCVRLNNGSGTFSGGADVPVGTAPRGLAVGDVDGDGDLDFVTANYSSNTVSVRLNALPPIITSFFPASAAAGTTVLVTGLHFTGLSAFSVNGISAFGSITGLTATSFSFVVPPGCTGPGTSIATNAEGPGSSTGFTALLLITSTNPLANAKAAPVANSAASLTFTEPVTTGSAANVKVFSAQVGGLKTGTVTTSGATANYVSTLASPRTNFKPGETVNITAPATVLSVGGGIALAPKVMQFTTAVSGTGIGNFVPQPVTPNPGAGSDPRSVAVGDVDGDGDLDLATANFGANTVSIRLNNGAGSFSGGSDPAVGTTPRTVVLGDVDGDGDLDLLTANQGSATLSVRLNNGAGSFSGGSDPSTTFFGGGSGSPKGLALGDVDGDGDLDVVSGSYNLGNALVKLNNGSGTFTNHPTTPTVSSFQPQDVKLGDVDGDGDLDLLTANTGTRVEIRINDGAGNFAGGSTCPLSGAPTQETHLALGDVDGDGDLDFVVTNVASNRAYVRLNNGAGLFSAPSVNPDFAITKADALALGDIDADGDLDLLTTSNAASGTVSVRLNDGTGNFTPFAANPNPPTDANPTDLAMGDVDGDGDLDFLTANATANTVSVRLNALPPVITSFFPAAAAAGTTVLVTGLRFTGLSAFTVNGISAFGSITGLTATSFSFVVPPGCTSSGTSIATTAEGTGSSTGFTALLLITSTNPLVNAKTAPVANSAASLTFTEPVTSGSAANLKVFSAQVGGLKAGTVTTSGSTASYVSTLAPPRRDFKPGETVSITAPATVLSAGGIALAPKVVQFTTAVGGTGIGNFVPHVTLPEPAVGASPNDVALGDVDGDGDLDMATANANASGTVSIRLNNGAGAFAGGSDPAVDIYPNSVALGDVDGDGDLDLITSNSFFFYGSISVRFNNGAGVFSGGADLPVGVSPFGVILGDVDGDGDLDVAFARYSGAATIVCLNNGAGVFSLGPAIGAGTNPRRVAFGDVDADGDLDLLTANWGSNTVSIRLNDGTGIFSSGSDPAVGSGPYSLAVGDVDGDGDLDLLTANDGSNTVSVRLNSGAGTFGGGSDPAVGLQPAHVVAGDIDHDGDLDLLTVNTGANTVSVRLNSGAGAFGSGSDVAVGALAASLALGDVDGDGDLDFATANQGSNTASVRMNAGPPSIVSFLPARAAAGTTVAVTGFDLLGMTAWTVNGINAFGSVTGLTATGFSFVVPPGCTPSGTSTATTSFGSGSSTGFTALLKVVTTNPVKHAPAAPIAVMSPSLTFTENITAGSASNLKIFSAQVGGLKPGTVSVAGATASYSSSLPPSRALFRPGEVVNVTVPPAVRSVGGSIGAEPFVYQFNVAAGGTGVGNFQPPVLNPNPAVGAAAPDVALGDVDGDGDLDAVASLTASNAVRVRLNNGLGSFTGGGALVSVGTGPVGIILGDVDGDADLDLLTTNTTANTVSLRLNSGAGVFSGGSDFAVGSNSQHLRLGDVDGDGDLDLLTANWGTNDISIRFNNGSGVFTGGTNVAVGTNPFDVEPGDFDNDGDLDFVATNYGGGTVSIRFNDGTGVFGGGSNPSFGGGGPAGLAVGDFDNDGDLDFACARNILGNTVVVWRNTGSGASFSAQTWLVGSLPLTVRAADVDHDGDLDLLVTNTGSATVSVLLNTAFAFITSSVYPSPAVGGTPAGLALGDVDADGDVDLVSADNSSGTNAVSVRFNQPPPPPTIISFTPPAATAGTTVAVTGTTLSDLTNWTVNGINAFASVTALTATSFNFVVPPGCTPSGTSTATTLWGSGGNGGFTALLKVASTNPAANAVAAPLALSAVGVTFTEPVTPISAFRLKVFSSQLGGQKNGVVSTSGSAANYISTLPVPNNAFRPGERVSVTVPTNVLSFGGIAATGRVYQFDAAVYGAGTGNFTTVGINPSPTVGANPNGVALGDLDGDSDLDLVTANFGGASASVRINDGVGNFLVTGGSDPGVGSQPRSIVLADVDNDGDLDMLTANQGGNTASVRFNDGAANFTAITADVPVGSAPRGIATADVDGDGDLDLLTANSGANTVSIRFNDGFGGFSGSTDFGVGSQPANLTVGDVDNDGDLDVLTANAGANTVSVRLNDGLGNFSGSTDYSVGTQPRSVAVGDVDGDGDLDLLTANFGANTLSVRFNSGSGAFSGSTNYSVGTGPFGLALGDVDADGDLDALTSNFTGSTVSVRLNDGSGTFAPPATNPNPGVLNNPAALALGDIDSDGDLDFVATNSVATTSGIYVSARLNQGLRPAVLALSPPAELTGLPVTISGTGFAPGSTVAFGGVPATTVSYFSPTTLVAVVPAGATAGPSAIVVTTGGISSPTPPPFQVLAVFDVFGTTCQGSIPYVATGDGNWHYLFATNGQVVAALRDTYAPLDTVAVQHRALGSAAPVRSDGYGHYYLDRDFHLTTSGGPFMGTTVQVRFFGLNAEMTRLQAADASVTYPTLKLTQYSGPREDCELTNDDFVNGDFRVLPAPASTPGGAVPWFVADVSIADHFSEFFLTNSSVPLPVELEAFTAKRQNRNVVNLNWKTASEKNNQGFIVERSVDGRAFAAISDLIAGHGTSITPNAYAWTDANAPADLTYYRLRQLDHDGTATTSAIVTVAPAPAVKAPQLTLWPNPAHTAVQVAGAEPRAVLLLLDATGRVVRELTATASGTATVPLAGLPAGVYGVRTPDGRFARLVVD